MKNNTDRVPHNGGNKRRPSQAKTDNYAVKQRQVSYQWVNEFIDDYQRLQFSRDEACNLLELGAALLRLHAKDDDGFAVAGHYKDLVFAAKQKMAIAVNTIGQTVFNIEPRTQDPWKTADEIKAGE